LRIPKNSFEMQSRSATKITLMFEALARRHPGRGRRRRRHGALHPGGERELLAAGAVLGSTGCIPKKLDWKSWLLKTPPETASSSSAG
jgi:hypothetical protein